MKRVLTHQYRQLSLIGVLALTLLFGHVAALRAQSSGLQITSVGVSNVGAGGATISFTTNVPAESRVVYDTSSHSQSSAYTFANPPTASGTPVYTGASTSSSIDLTGLLASTTYHFRIEVKDTSGVVLSADRTFTTTSGATTGAGLLVTNIRSDCIDTRCQLSFTTNQNARVEIRWATSFQANFSSYPNSVAEPTTIPYPSGTRSLLISGLSASTTYHYRLQAIDESGANTFGPTNDLTFQTSANGSDHTFSTGSCSDGTDIGQCNANREYCDNGGNLVQDCTSVCGYTCPSNQTCNASGQCLVDPSLTGSPLQCNASSCYDPAGRLINPAPAGCYASWSRCNANTILKVQKDRGCNLWLTCATSVQTEPSSTAPAENLCLSLAACNSLGLEGQCNKYLPQGQCSNDPLRFCSNDSDCVGGGTCNTSPTDQPTQSLQNITYQTPEEVSNIADLSGNVVAGLDWHNVGGTNVITGMLPWQLMRQVGGNVQDKIKNGDFEYNPPSFAPWVSAPDLVAPTKDFPATTSMSVEFEDKDNSINHVLKFEPVTANNNSKHCSLTQTSGQPTDCTTDDALCTTANDTCVADPVSYSGVATPDFDVSASEYYYAEVRIKTDLTNSPVMRVQFGYDNYSRFSVGSTPTFVDVPVTTAWQRVTLGPLTGMSGKTRLAVVCADSSTCGGPIYIDDVQIRPVLQADTNPTYITPSCRLYPREDSPSCDYVDQNNVIYKGWHGYCLEHDSQTGTCLSWWPVDVLKGDTNIFGADSTAGYQDRAPLYLCVEGAGNAGGNVFNANDNPYVVAEVPPSGGYRDDSGNSCDNSGGCFGVVNGGNYTIAACSTNSLTCHVSGGSKTTVLHDYDISVAKFRFVGGLPNENPSVTFVNNGDWQNTSAANAQTGYDFDTRIPFSQYRDVNSTYIIWRHDVNCTGSQLNANCNSVRLYFSATTHLFLAYEISVNDQTGDNTEMVAYQVSFITKESCKQLVQVVSPTGQNKAFASRISSNSYAVPGINYTKITDLQPFGGALLAAGQTVPGNTLLHTETPDYTTYGATGQARGGGPYACNGPCGDFICTATGATCMTNGKLDQSLVTACQTHTTSSGLPDPGECVGVAGSGTLSSKGPQILDPNVDPTAVATPGGSCSSSTTLTCDASTTVSTQVFGGITAGPAAQSTLTNKCRSIVACDGSNASCSGGTSVNYSGIKDFACTPALNLGIFHTCTATCTVPNGTTYQSVVRQVSTSYFAEQGIRRLFTESYGLYAWSDALQAYQPVSGSLGSVGTICPNDPATGQPKRPDYPDDFCSVPPSISNAAFLNSDARTASISSGSGSIGIKFNTTADVDQVPLTAISIAWGDTTTGNAGNFAPRNDPAKPHIFSHAYVFNRGDNAHCDYDRNICTYHIKIQIQDNWGWCNDGTHGPCTTDTNRWYDTGLTVTVTP